MSDITTPGPAPFINADRAGDLYYELEALANAIGERADHLFQYEPLASTDGRSDAWYTLADRVRHCADLMDDISTDIANQNKKESEK